MTCYCKTDRKLINQIYIFIKSATVAGKPINNRLKQILELYKYDHNYYTEYSDIFLKTYTVKKYGLYI